MEQIKRESIAEKLDRLSALNALLNMDEKGDDGIGMEDDAPEPGEERVADKSAQRVSLKERLAEMQTRVAGGSVEKAEMQKMKGKEVSM
jgi:hypothetical protein